MPKETGYEARYVATVLRNNEPANEARIVTIKDVVRVSATRDGTLAIHDEKGGGRMFSFGTWADVTLVMHPAKVR